MLAPDALRARSVSAAKAAAALALIALTLGLLPILAERELRTRLLEQSAYELALQAAGKSPWQWPLREADDIVAGRVFGAHEFAFDAGGLLVHSDGAPFEIGLPLARAVDLRRYPTVHIKAAASAPATVRAVVRATLDAPQSESPPIPLRDTETALDLRSGALPERAAMLRLRFELAAGQTLRLQAASLELAPGAAPAPIRELPPGTVEQQMLALRRIREDTPAAVVVPSGSVEAVSGDQRLSALGTRVTLWPRDVVIGLFIAMLLIARLRPPRHVRVRALVEIILVLIVPMWLIVAEHFTGRIDPGQGLLIAAAAVFAWSLAWPRTWHWNGSLRGWMLAAGIVALAAWIGLVLHHAGEFRAIPTGHVVRYLGWALVQQFLICAVCLERWRIVSGSRAVAIYLSALCFALLHTPNATLMLATFVGGLCWCTLYLREHALLPLAFSHAASALLLLALLPQDVLLSAEVGARFFQ